mmetsp:Transcript_28433/g.43771  ORF Transcript_28433/g.43771 Transcript_28433/m.43771 type:complete len:107 (+) Transcript_28433:231-551(+)
MDCSISLGRRGDHNHLPLQRLEKWLFLIQTNRQLCLLASLKHCVPASPGTSSSQPQTPTGAGFSLIWDHGGGCSREATASATADQMAPNRLDLGGSKGRSMVNTGH